MAPLGLQMTTVGALGGPGMMGDPGKTATREDFIWECSGLSNLTPIDPSLQGTDNNDMWDYTPSEYTPEDDSTNENEGYWEVDGTNLIKPVDMTGLCG